MKKVITCANMIPAIE